MPIRGTHNVFDAHASHSVGTLSTRIVEYNKKKNNQSYKWLLQKNLIMV